MTFKDKYAVARRNGRKRRQQVRAVQALVDKLKREQAIAAATHAYPALSCPVRCFLVNCLIYGRKACKHAVQVIVHLPYTQLCSCSCVDTAV